MKLKTWINPAHADDARRVARAIVTSRIEPAPLDDPLLERVTVELDGMKWRTFRDYATADRAHDDLAQIVAGIYEAGREQGRRESANAGAPAGLAEALNSGDGSYRP